MKIIKITMSLKCCLVVMVFASACAWGEELVNGGFEAVVDKPNLKACVQQLAEGWRTVLNTGIGKVRGEVSADAHGGSHSMHLVAKEPKSFIGVYQEVACEPDSAMKLSAYIRGKKGTREYFRIFFFDETGKRDSKYLMPGWVSQDSSTWVLREYKFQVPTHARRMSIGVETLSNQFADAEIFVDDVVLEKQSSPVLRNELLRAVVNPLYGGCIDSLTAVINGKNVEFTIPRTMNSNGGMALEIIPMRRSPGMFANKSYEWTVLEPHRKIRVSRTCNDGELSGLQVSKTFTLEPATTSIRVELELKNTSADDIATSCRVSNMLAPADGFVTSPTRDWLQVFQKNAETISTTNAVESNNLQHGFLAKTTQDGAIVGQFDLSQVSGGYNWVSADVDTMEWHYPEINLAPGAVYKATYAIHIGYGARPVVGFDGDRIVGVDSLTAPTTASITALKKLDDAVTLNGRKTALSLAAGETTAFELSDGTMDYARGNCSLEYGGKYKALFIRGIKLPPPKPVSKAPRLEKYFPFIFNGDVALTWKESTGLDGRAAQFLRNAESNFRECAAVGFNACSNGRIIQKGIFDVANTPDGGNRIGEWCKKYDMGFFVSTHLYMKDDVELEKFRPKLKTRMDLFYSPGFLTFLKTYDSCIKGVFTADETTAQNIPCMLEAHEALSQKLAPDISLYPYLNIHTRVYIPYVPVFFGDWYPINHKENGGRNPWSTGKVTAETVAMAKGIPVHVILQCFAYFKKGYGLPTPAEARLMCHLAVANGAQGIEMYEVNNRGLSWRYNYGYHYTARGNAGENSPLFFTLGECARELTAIGAQMTDARSQNVPSCVMMDAPDYKSANGYYDGPQVKLYALGREDGTVFVVAVNQSEKTGIEQAITFSPRNSETVVSLTAMKPIGTAHTMTLRAGDAEYFVMGKADSVSAVLNSVALARARREGVAFGIATERAAGNGVEMTAARKMEEESMALAKACDGLGALAKIREAEALRSQTVAASSFGAFDASWADARQALSDACFMFLTHFDLVIPPALREKTARYARWNNTEDPVMQALVDEVAECWTEYWQIEQAIVEGRLGGERSRADALIKRAHKAADAAVAYLRANEHKIKIDYPYEE